MTRQTSFTKHERKVLPDFRQKINNSESTEDVKKFFSYTVTSLLKEILPEDVTPEFEDIRLAPGSSPPYRVSDRLMETPEFSRTWQNSDLSKMLERLAETALNRYRRLEKHPEKTDSKIQRRYENR
ncbi:MAG: hypothetical protein KGY42_09600 [Desulfobacterales bacterium]|nr:hypothetical protein [Desulfobacterales bacterium]MBS3756122.1 hypothetical protein [Desulfobacterales bacterium]